MYQDEEEFDEVYDGQDREDMVDNDEITAEEEAFMKGYDEDQRDSDNKSVADKAFEDAFEKKSRRSKRKAETFDEEEIEAEVSMR